jgi:hypothetical protein
MDFWARKLATLVVESAKKNIYSALRAFSKIFHSSSIDSLPIFKRGLNLVE